MNTEEKAVAWAVGLAKRTSRKNLETGQDRTCRELKLAFSA
jgi:hypothetical protein